MIQDHAYHCTKCIGNIVNTGIYTICWDGSASSLTRLAIFSFDFVFFCLSSFSLAAYAKNNSCCSTLILLNLRRTILAVDSLILRILAAEPTLQFFSITSLINLDLVCIKKMIPIWIDGYSLAWFHADSSHPQKLLSPFSLV